MRSHAKLPSFLHLCAVHLVISPPQGAVSRSQPSWWRQHRRVAVTRSLMATNDCELPVEAKNGLLCLDGVFMSKEEAVAWVAVTMVHMTRVAEIGGACGGGRGEHRRCSWLQRFRLRGSLITVFILSFVASSAIPYTVDRCSIAGCPSQWLHMKVSQSPSPSLQRSWPLDGQLGRSTRFVSRSTERVAVVDSCFFGAPRFSV